MLKFQELIYRKKKHDMYLVLVCFDLDMFVAETVNFCYVGKTCYEHHDRTMEDINGFTWWYLLWSRLVLLQVWLYDWQKERNHTEYLLVFVFTFRGLEHTYGITTLQLGEYVHNVSNGVDTYSNRAPLDFCASICPFQINPRIFCYRQTGQNS